jgi:hypothetical protein
MGPSSLYDLLRKPVFRWPVAAVPLVAPIRLASHARIYLACDLDVESARHWGAVSRTERLQAETLVVDRTPEQFLTPPEVAKIWRVRRETVLGWIKSGELKAINIAEPCRRPRYRVDPMDLTAFKERRSVSPRQPMPKRNGRTDVIEFY